MEYAECGCLIQFMILGHGREVEISGLKIIETCDDHYPMPED